ncbi:uncharacterized protein [Typha latifolia]|uniref:uncharacterized protein n=1 Tax=Typha latifolia TaxID=4733 RepID=UPI003C2D192E
MELLTSLILSLFISLLAPTSLAADTLPPGKIQRITKQQILATIPPNGQQNSIPFITSPSGKYTAYFLRRETAPGAGGFGNEFCYVQVQETSSGKSMWESECSSVSTVNTCVLMFSWNGLEIFDGSNSVWDCGAQSDDNTFLETLELVDEGDMRIIDKDGELAWKASDQPRVNQRCGLPGSPGLAPGLPPFAQPIGLDKNLPFGQQPQGGEVQQQLPQPADLGNQEQPVDLGNQEQQPQKPLNGAATQAFGFNSQPLVDNSPYDSGCSREEYLVSLGLGLLLTLLVHGFIF